ncbi:hypothetical protein QF017_006395, partial [Pseudomonas laurylsulfatiphila]
AGLPAMAACLPARIWRIHLDPVGAGLPAMAAYRPA